MGSYSTTSDLYEPSLYRTVSYTYLELRDDIDELRVDFGASACISRLGVHDIYRCSESMLTTFMSSNTLDFTFFLADAAGALEEEGSGVEGAAADVGGGGCECHEV